MLWHKATPRQCLVYGIKCTGHGKQNTLRQYADQCSRSSGTGMMGKLYKMFARMTVCLMNNQMNWTGVLM